jgi:Universal stress protein family
MEKIVSSLRAAGVSAEGGIREANYGHIAAAILRAAHEHGARLVVLGSRSRTDLPRVPLGSVSTGCCTPPPGRSSSCPDLTPRPGQRRPRRPRRQPESAEHISLGPRHSMAGGDLGCSATGWRGGPEAITTGTQCGSSEAAAAPVT